MTSQAYLSPNSSNGHIGDSDAYVLWESIKSSLRKVYGDLGYKRWIAPLEFRNFSAGIVTLAAPSAFMRDWVTNNYLFDIQESFRKLEPSVIKVVIVMDQSLQEKVDEGTALSNKAQQVNEGQQGLNHSNPTGYNSSKQTGFNSVEEGERSDVLDFGELEVIGSRLEPRYSFDNFVVGQSNELAHAAARRVAESREVHFNPLFIYGGVGLGKTHLMHAIAWHIAQHQPQRKVIYLSAEKFMYLFIKALRFKDTVAFKEKFRSVDVLMIDDFQFISGKESTQEEFFHTFNALVDQNHQVIISADKSPSDLDGLEDRMRSRLGWGLVADIHPTTYELRLGILQSKVEQLQVEVPQNVLEFLAHKISSNIRELEGALNRIVAHSTLVGRAISLDSTQLLLRDILRASDRRVCIEEIQRKVAEHYNIKIADMHSVRRMRSVARPRQIAMYLAKQLTEASLPEIGRKFGGRDHATVMHAVKKVQELICEDQSLHEDVDLLKRMLSGQ